MSRMADADHEAARVRDGASLATALARTVASKLRAGIDARGAAVLAVSGGSTPARFFAALSKEHLDWTKVVVTLVDERLVPPSSERSNEKLVRDALLRNEARLARFIGLYSEAGSVDAAMQADAGLSLMGPVFDVVILGMGADGHTASFFPDAPNLDDLTNPAQARRVMAVDAPSGGEPRLTLTLPLIVDARFVGAPYRGREKRKCWRVLRRRPPSPIGRAVHRLPIARFSASTRPLPRIASFTGRPWKEIRHDRTQRHRSHNRPHPRAIAASPRDLSRPRRCRRRRSANRAVLSCGNLAHGFAACSPTPDKDSTWGRPGAQSRHHHLLQRHAVGASAVRDLPATDQAGGARGRWHRAGGGRRAGDVRRRHPGPAGHGTVAVLARRDRHGDGRRPVAQHVRRCGLSRRLRQDRAGAGDRCADLRPSAGRVHSGRADDIGLPNDEKARVRQLYAEGKVGRPNCWRPSPSPTTAPAPAPSTARPTPTRC